jgi:hypothetical protein
MIVAANLSGQPDNVQFRGNWVTRFVLFRVISWIVLFTWTDTIHESTRNTRTM